MYDASLVGYAVVQGRLEMKETGEMMAYQERWRFKHEEVRAIPARVRAMQGRDPLFDIDTVRSSLAGEIPPMVVWTPCSQRFPMRFWNPRVGVSAGEPLSKI